MPPASLSPNKAMLSLCFFEIAKTYNITNCFDGIQNTVGARKLAKGRAAAVLIYPESIQVVHRNRKEHVHNNQQINFAVFYPLRKSL
jgi:hypothetical protein